MAYFKELVHNFLEALTKAETCGVPIQGILPNILEFGTGQRVSCSDTSIMKK
jgi:hypothetical protein